MKKGYALSVSAAEARWFKRRYLAITSLVGEFPPHFSLIVRW